MRKEVTTLNKEVFYWQPTGRQRRVKQKLIWKDGILASIGKRGMSYEDWINCKLWKNKTTFG